MRHSRGRDRLRLFLLCNGWGLFRFSLPGLASFTKLLPRPLTTALLCRRQGTWYGIEPPVHYKVCTAQVNTAPDGKLITIRTSAEQ